MSASRHPTLAAARPGTPADNRDAPEAREFASLAAALERSAPEAAADTVFLNGLRSNLRAAHPGRGTAASEPLLYWRVATVAGTLFVAATRKAVRATDLTEDEGLFVRECTARFGSAPRPAATPPPRLQRAIQGFLATGRYRGPVDLTGVPAFMRRVLMETLTIPRGQVRPYGWLAAVTGQPRAARAVGSAMAHNPIPVLIPCHRVVRSDYSIGEYGCGGPDKKREILAAEGVDLAALAAFARSGTRLVGSNTTRVFCLPLCPDARRIQPSHQVPFRGSNAAAAAGFRACRKCRPA
jgi:O-6-methylguanine DNA methyltransferase